MKENFKKEADLYILLAIMSLILFVGCSALLDTGKAAKNAAIVDQAISSGKAQQSLELVALSDFEKMTIVHALNQYAEFKEKYKNVATLKAGSFEFAEFKSDYALLKNEYQNVKNIVENHWDEYTDTTKILLKNDDRKAVALDASIQKLFDLSDQHKAILDAVEFAFVAGGIAKKAF